MLVESTDDRPHQPARGIATERLARRYQLDPRMIELLHTHDLSCQVTRKAAERKDEHHIKRSWFACSGCHEGPKLRSVLVSARDARLLEHANEVGVISPAPFLESRDLARHARAVLRLILGRNPHISRRSAARRFVSAVFHNCIFLRSIFSQLTVSRSSSSASVELRYASTRSISSTDTGSLSGRSHTMQRANCEGEPSGCLLLLSR